MTTEKPSPEALGTACALLYGREHLWDDPDLKERDIALALDRFRAAGVEAERATIIRGLRLAASDYGRSGYGDALNDFADDLEEVVP